jgi:hypothetical protein
LRRFLAAAAIGGIAVVMTLNSSPASASTSAPASPATVAVDDQPCSGAFIHQPSGLEMRYCPDWAPSGRSIPVHQNTSKSSQVVGYINPAGADWYYCQQQGDRYTLGQYVNNWYAYTMADNGRWGWVNEVYFQGGDNNERDAGLGGCIGI